MPRGRLPMGMFATTLSDPAAMAVTVFERSFVTYTNGSAPALTGVIASTANNSSATLSLPSAIVSPPSWREPAPAIRRRRAERVEVSPAQVTHDGEGPDLRAPVVPPPGPRHVEGLPQLVIPFGNREGVALVAIERRRRLQERDERVSVGGAGPRHRLADQLDRGPRRPCRLGHRRVPPTAEARVELAGAEALQLVVPADRPEPGRALGGEAKPGLAETGDPVRPPSLGDRARHRRFHCAWVESQQHD